MSQLFRARVIRTDGRAINVGQRRAHLSYCFTGWADALLDASASGVHVVEREGFSATQAANFVTDATAAILVTDGHANVPTTTDDPWADALDAARALGCPSIVIDSEDERQATGRPGLLAQAMCGTHVRLADLDPVALLHVIRRTS